MDLRDEARTAAMLMRVVMYPASVERLSARPDWCETLEQRLTQLHYAQPSVVWFLRGYADQLAEATQNAELQPVLQIPSITQSDLHRGIGHQLISMPVMPGEVGVAITWDRETSEEEFMVKARELFRDGRVALTEMHQDARRSALERERAHSRELREQAEQGGPDAEGLLALADASAERVRRLEQPEIARRVRLGDRLARDMWFLRAFLRDAATTTAIGTRWAETLERWMSSSRPERDPIDSLAQHEWRRAGPRDEPHVDSSLVGRRLRVWLGKRLGPNALVRPDPSSPSGFRRFCRLDQRLRKPGAIVGPSMCHGLSGRAHELFHERQIARGS